MMCDKQVLARMKGKGYVVVVRLDHGEDRDGWIIHLLPTLKIVKRAN